MLPPRRRLLVDLTALRHMVNDEYQRWGRELPGAKTLRWVPTKSQLADILTKVLNDVKQWWWNVRWTDLPFSASPTV